MNGYNKRNPVIGIRMEKEKLEQMDQQLKEGETRTDFIKKAITNELKGSLSKEEFEKMIEKTRIEEREKGIQIGHAKCKEEYDQTGIFIKNTEKIEQGRLLCNLTSGGNISSTGFVEYSAIITNAYLLLRLQNRLTEKTPWGEVIRTAKLTWKG